MNESKQKQVLLIIIAILIFANAVTLVMLFTNRPSHRKGGPNSRKNSMVTYLKKDLGFNDVQIATYDSLHKKHIEIVEEMFKEMRLEKKKSFKYLAEQGFSDSIIAITGNTISERQKGLEIKMLRHLREMRSIATPAQQAKFDTTFFKFMTREKGRKKNKL